MKEREKTSTIPVVTDVGVNDILRKVRDMFDITDRKELMTALSHFIEWMEINGQDVTLQYKIMKPTTEIVLSNGDPEGIWTPDLHRDRVAC